MSERKHLKRSDNVLGWHGIKDTRHLAYNMSSVKVVEGRTYSPPPREDVNITTCYYGMHSCLKGTDLLTWTGGPIICRVHVWGEACIDHSKLATRYRKVLWIRDGRPAFRGMTQELIDLILKTLEQYKGVRVRTKRLLLDMRESITSGIVPKDLNKRVRIEQESKDVRYKPIGSHISLYGIWTALFDAIYQCDYSAINAQYKYTVSELIDPGDITTLCSEMFHTMDIGYDVMDKIVERNLLRLAKIKE